MVDNYHAATQTFFYHYRWDDFLIAGRIGCYVLHKQT